MFLNQMMMNEKPDVNTILSKLYKVSLYPDKLIYYQLIYQKISTHLPTTN
jgi:hypothetical protein